MHIAPNTSWRTSPVLTTSVAAEAEEALVTPTARTEESRNPRTTTSSSYYARGADAPPGRAATAGSCRVRASDYSSDSTPCAKRKATVAPTDNAASANNATSYLLMRRDALVAEFSRVQADEDRLRALLARAFALLPPDDPVTEAVADELGCSLPQAQAAVAATALMELP